MNKLYTISVVIHRHKFVLGQLCKCLVYLGNHVVLAECLTRASLYVNVLGSTHGCQHISGS